SNDTCTHERRAGQLPGGCTDRQGRCPDDERSLASAEIASLVLNHRVRGIGRQSGNDGNWGPCVAAPRGRINPPRSAATIAISRSATIVIASAVTSATTTGHRKGGSRETTAPPIVSCPGSDMVRVSLCTPS